MNDNVVIRVAVFRNLRGYSDVRARGITLAVYQFASNGYSVFAIGNEARSYDTQRALKFPRLRIDYEQTRAVGFQLTGVEIACPSDTGEKRIAAILG